MSDRQPEKLVTMPPLLERPIKHYPWRLSTATICIAFVLFINAHYILGWLMVNAWIVHKIVEDKYIIPWQRRKKQQKRGPIV